MIGTEKEFTLEIKRILKSEGLLGRAPVMLMSLREQPYQSILDGTKKYEFRSRFPKKGCLAFLYVSNTVREIRGVAHFGRPLWNTAQALKKQGVLSPTDSVEVLDNYFHHGAGYAIPVLKTWELHPIKLEELKSLFPAFIVPQSYFWLDKKPELLAHLLETEVEAWHDSSSSAF